MVRLGRRHQEGQSASLSKSARELHVLVVAPQALVECLCQGTEIQKRVPTVEGGGGGHDIAAGAYIPVTMESVFLSEVNRLVAKALA